MDYIFSDIFLSSAFSASWGWGLVLLATEEEQQQVERRKGSEHPNLRIPNLDFPIPLG